MDALTEMMKVPYLAGFFDGEGYVGVPSGSLKLTVVQVNPAPLRLFRDRYGGSIQAIKYDNLKWRHAFAWGASRRSAEAALREMLPYLVVKREEAELALSFLDLPKGKGNLTDEVRQARLDIDSKMKFLKRREYSPEAALEAKVDEYFADAI